MKRLDGLSEKSARHLARRTSRRGFLSKLGAFVVGASAVPLLPVARAQSSSRASAPDESGIEGDAGDPMKCEYWRHCAFDGFLSACCGGSTTVCPPGTVVSPITWIGTCRNPADGKDYIISYNDCCGKSSCGRCFCNRNEGDRPVYYPRLSNDINWCVGSEGDVVYHSTLAVVLGLATESE